LNLGRYKFKKIKRSVAVTAIVIKRLFFKKKPAKKIAGSIKKLIDGFKL
jgi:hypothetical protein